MAREREESDFGSHHYHRAPSNGQYSRREAANWQENLNFAHRLAARDGKDPLQVFTRLWAPRSDPNQVRKCAPMDVVPVISYGPSQNAGEPTQDITATSSRVLSLLLQA